MKNGRLGGFACWACGVLFAVFFLMPGLVFASGYYTGQRDAPYVFKGPSAVGIAQDYCDWLVPNSGGTTSQCNATGSEPSDPEDGVQYSITFSYYTYKWRSGQFYATYHECPSGEVWNEGLGACSPPVVDCSSHAGKVIQRWTQAGLGGQINVSGCEYESSGVGLCVPHLDGYNCYSDYTGSGAVYSEGDGAPETPNASQPPCIAGDSGNRVCGNPQQMNCGKFNGTSYCVSPQDVPGCKHSVGNLSVICSMNPDGSSPPDAPTTDFGSPIAADQTWDHADQEQGVHHMGGWSGSGSGDGSGDGSGGGDPGTVSGGSSIEGDNNGDGECQSGEDCLGGGPALGEHPALPVEDATGVDWVSGLPSSGICPAPQQIAIPEAFGGGTIPISYQPMCDFAAMIRPLILAAAYLSAAFIMIRGLG